MTGQAKGFRVELTINAGRDAVWPAITVPEQIRQWFGWEHDGIDAEIRHIFVDRAELDPPEGMVFEDGSELELASDGPRTVVRLVREDPTTGRELEFDAIEEGWRAFLEQLRFLLETHPQGLRRTVYLSGPAAGGHAAALAGAGAQVWHDSRYLHMAVDSAGHLVAVASEAPLGGDGVAHTAVTVTTYGLDDAAFATVRDEWTARWAQASS